MKDNSDGLLRPDSMSLVRMKNAAGMLGLLPMSYFMDKGFM